MPQKILMCCVILTHAMVHFHTENACSLHFMLLRVIFIISHVSVDAFLFTHHCIHASCHVH